MLCVVTRYNAYVSILCTKYRIYPTKQQETFLEKTLETCRGLYNSLLNSRRHEYEVNGKSPTLHNQINAVTAYKKGFPELACIHSQVLQNVAVRVDLAFQAFFRRVKSGQTPGFPRMKGDGYDSFCYPGSGFAINEASLRLSKVGIVKAVIHRMSEGTVKTCTVKRQNGKWFATFSVETAVERLPDNDKSIGIDVGLEKFAALSNDTYIDNPRFYRKEERALAAAQRKADKHKKRCRKQAKAEKLAKAKKIVSRVHKRIRNKRHDFIHQQSRKIVNAYGIIAVEKLNVKNLSKSPAPKPDAQNEGQFLPNGATRKSGLNKSILDAGWTMFRCALAYKAENAGRVFLEVNPAFTSQDCHSCGYRAKKKLSDRWHLCPICGASVDRDMNAAINILALGLKSLSVEPSA